MSVAVLTDPDPMPAPLARALRRNRRVGLALRCPVWGELWWTPAFRRACLNLCASGFVDGVVCAAVVGRRRSVLFVGHRWRGRTWDVRRAVAAAWHHAAFGPARCRCRLVVADIATGRILGTFTSRRWNEHRDRLEDHRGGRAKFAPVGRYARLMPDPTRLFVRPGAGVAR